MKSDYKKLGEYIRAVDVRNSDDLLGEESLYGISVTKEFIVSHANLVGVTFDSYKVVAPRKFAYIPDTSRRGDKIAISLNTLGEKIIVSSICTVFEIIDEAKMLPEYLMLWFMRPEFDRYARFMSNGSAREVFDWDSMCDVELPVPPIDVQRKIVHDYQVITDRITLLRKINDNLIEAGTILFTSFFDSREECFDVPLYDLAEYINGTSFDEEEYADDGVPIIKIAELKDGITSATQYFVGQKDKKYLIENGDVLFSWSGNPETSIDVFIWTHGSGILNQHTFKMICPHGKAYTFFMLKYCKPDFIKAAQGKQTTGLGHVTVQDLKRLTIPFDAEIAKEFNDQGMPVFNFICRNLQEINLLSSMKSQLLVSISRAKGA